MERLAKVVIGFSGGNEQVAIMAIDQVVKFLKASYALYVEPGVNPHNGNKTARAEMFSVMPLRKASYWWSSESLGVNAPHSGPYSDAAEVFTECDLLVWNVSDESNDLQSMLVRFGEFVT